MITKEMYMQYSDEELIKLLPNFNNHFINVNGIQLHYVIGGQGDPLVLIPGYPETWWAYNKVMPILIKKYRVIVIDIRGMGSSDKPFEGYDKRNMAKDVFELVQHLGLKRISIAGHDIGAHVAFSFAVNYSDIVAKLIMLDTPHPDEGMYQLPMLPILGANYLYPWWLSFNQVKELPERLLEGRMDVVIEWLFNHLLKDVNSISDFHKSVYAAAYNNKDAIRASNGWYQAFPQDIQDMKTYNKLSVPTLGIGGSGYDMLAMSLPKMISNVKLKKIENSGHFLLTEKPTETVELMIDFLEH
ncbi:alpha/beta fold hydrolase [Niabella beijingensis]|uniref:alpha/beta fold hydrolase n=2 Tax=Bacteroidota TaxID=976 RepID=UPI001CBD73B5|nr:alpha/beta hydrolase [Niabella beijingensis]